MPAGPPSRDGGYWSSWSDQTTYKGAIEEQSAEDIVIAGVSRSLARIGGIYFSSVQYQTNIKII